ncbi:MAG: excinuclease ABC subunit B [Spirochaetales bacterium]|nr:excinuclease ABC subunit B [Spirochaetales bacterium]
MGVEKIFKLVSEYEPAGDQPVAIEKLYSGLCSNYKYQTLLGVTGSGKTFTMAKLIEASQKPTLIISHNKTLAAQLFREFKNFFPENAVEYFVSYYDYYQPEAYVPSRDLYIEKDSSINEEIDRLRLSTTSSLLDRKDVIVIATVSGIYGLGSPKNFKEMRLSLRKGKEIDTREVAAHLLKLQYSRNDNLLERGNFRIRGDVLEIFPAYMKEAYRIELEWDEVKAIKLIDPLNGNTITEMDFTVVYPAKHFVMPEEGIESALQKIEAELKEQYDFFMSKGKIIEAERIKTRTEYDLEMIREMGYCNGIENYSRHLDGRQKGERPGVLLDYFPDDYLLFIDESHVTVPQIGGMYEGDKARKQNLVDFGFRLPSALDNRPLYYSEFDSMINQVVFVSATPSKEEKAKSIQFVEQIIRPTGLIDPEIDIRKTQGQIEDLYSEIQTRIKKKERVLVTTLTKKMAENLSEYLANLGIKVRYMHSEIDTIERVEIIKQLRQGKIDVIVGINLLREGLDIPEVSLVAILDADKIGFLRSATSLIQTIGRAARNLNGRVIMYADKYSDAMKQAIEETDRRREIQRQFNIDNNITPRSISKSIEDILERQHEKIEKEAATISDIKSRYNLMSSKDRKNLIKALEIKMFEHAKNLEFEEAALVRDEIDSLKGLM